MGVQKTYEKDNIVLSLYDIWEIYNPKSNKKFRNTFNTHCMNTIFVDIFVLYILETTEQMNHIP